jgi:heat shock protein HslJ
MAGTEITALFKENGELAGSAGCNNYMMSYQVNGSSIKTSPAAITMMFCPEPEGIMDQENEYLAALQSASRFELQRKELTLFDANNTKAVGYRAVSKQPILQDEA